MITKVPRTTSGENLATQNQNVEKPKPTNVKNLTKIFETKREDGGKIPEKGEIEHPEFWNNKFKIIKKIVENRMKKENVETKQSNRKNSFKSGTCFPSPFKSQVFKLYNLSSWF